MARLTPARTGPGRDVLRGREGAGSNAMGVLAGAALASGVLAVLFMLAVALWWPSLMPQIYG